VERFAALTREEREPVTGQMRRNAGKDRAGTQGCLRQEARPTSSGSEAEKYIPGSDARRSIRGRKARFAGKEPLKAGRWVEHGPAGKDQRAACRGERLFARNGFAVDNSRDSVVTGRHIF
jgi:hypothetical protein